MSSQPTACRRSCLSVPGSSTKMLAKAAGTNADEVVIDLEDSVAIPEKDRAREVVVSVLAGREWKARSVAVRVNPPGTPWCHRDLVALAELPGPPFSVVLPKVEGAGDIEFADRLLRGSERGTRPLLQVQALVETAAGIERVAEIGRAAPGRLTTLILGYADLAASLGRSEAAARDPHAWLAMQDAVLIAARANELQAIDGPYLGTSPDDGFERAAGRAAELGFDGKWAIHPAQLDRLNELFTPSDEERAWAQRVLETLSSAERSGGSGAVALDGQMLDEAIRAAAKRVLARAVSVG